jgi:hypothetical protein
VSFDAQYPNARCTAGFFAFFLFFRPLSKKYIIMGHRDDSIFFLKWLKKRGKRGERRRGKSTSEVGGDNALRPTG